MTLENIQKKEEVQAIIDRLERKLNKHAFQTIAREQEDLLQDVKLKIVEKAYVMLDEEPLGFFEFIEKEILKEEIVL